MKTRIDAWLWLAQRISAGLLAITVTIHLATLIYVANETFSAADVLARTRGSLAWLAVYGIFVTAAAVHVPIGLRDILIEWTSIRRDGVNVIAWTFACLLAVLGWRAVWNLFA
ncbi:hypothetical protein [Acidihalobacter prosperus]|uniref:Succinate dehydrogenase n=1 Tax=Acidihalobacter prosperus TaxID=160660 RepID=A0A1A6C8E7_9GAMM|nr:hypothetical protein [Acidihalobacter prosperus]OBS10842.1 hypothetical protein Thpro_020558 [Acidihalobacter prosperus]